MVKEYVNKAGYKIKASEKAYNMLYKKNGFKPVEEKSPEEVPNREETETGVSPADQDVSSTETKTEDSPADQDASDTGKKPKKPRAKKTDDPAEPHSGAETEAGDSLANQDAAEQPESE